MKVKLPRNLFPQIYEDISVNPASRRKVVLPRITRQVMEMKGYSFGNKIKVPGGYASEVTTPDGKSCRVGLKTAVNRWLNTATTLVEMVDTVIVTTFQWDEADEHPVALELIEISSAELLKMIEQVRDEATKRGGDPFGHYYMPLDPELMEEGPVGCTAGAVISRGQILLEPTPVTWVDDEWGRIEVGASTQQEVPDRNEGVATALDVAGIVARAKTGLAQELGISADKIDLSIRF